MMVCDKETTKKWKLLHRVFVQAGMAQVLENVYDRWDVVVTESVNIIQVMRYDLVLR